MPYVFETESADLDMMLSDSMHSITRNSIRRQCFYDLASDTGDEPGGAAAQVLEMETAGVKADHFPDIAEGDAVSVSEKRGWTRNYMVVQITRNGSMKELLLQRVL